MAKIIDHTLVKPTTTNRDAAKLCTEAREYGFGCVCVNSTYVSLATQLLKKTDTKVCSTVGFPFGTVLPEVKTFEARKAIENGAHEIDMVINTGALKSGDHKTVKRDIESVVDIKRSFSNLIVKVIIETANLTRQEKIVACRLAKGAGADFLKTSTGLTDGATVEDVRLMHATVGQEMGVKAAGGIRTFQQALEMIQAGANRLGTSTGVAIIEAFPK